MNFDSNFPKCTNYYSLNTSALDQVNSGKRDFSALDNSIDLDNSSDNEERPSKITRYNNNNYFSHEVQKFEFNKIFQDFPIYHSSNQNIHKEFFPIEKPFSAQKHYSIMESIFQVEKNKNVDLSKEEQISSGEQSEEDPEWIKALDIFRESGKSDQLLELIKNDGLLGVNEEDIEEIFDIGLTNNDRRVVLECVKMGLSEEDLGDAFRFSLNYNYGELIRAILNGVNGQTPLNFIKWSKGNPILGIDAYKEKHGDEAIIDLLCSKASISKQALEEHEWRICLANMWDIQGKFILDGIEDEYEGAFIYYFIDKILSSIQSFKLEFPDTVDNDLLDMLYKLIDESRTTSDVKEKISRFQMKEPIMIHGGMQGHHMEVILWQSLEQSYLLICNKGLLSEVPVKVYSINPALVNAELIEKIHTGGAQYKKYEEAKTFYTSILPNLLEGTPHKVLTDILKKYWVEVDESLVQIGENCVWESLHTAMFGAAGMQAWIKNSCEEKANIKMQENTILQTFQQGKQWSNYVGLWGLGEYLNNSEKDSSNLDKKLVEAILNKAKSRKGNKSMNDQYLQIFNKYRQVSERFATKNLVQQ